MTVVALRRRRLVVARVQVDDSCRTTPLSRLTNPGAIDLSPHDELDGRRRGCRSTVGRGGAGGLGGGGRGGLGGRRRTREGVQRWRADDRLPSALPFQHTGLDGRPGPTAGGGARSRGQTPPFGPRRSRPIQRQPSCPTFRVRFEYVAPSFVEKVLPHFRPPPVLLARRAPFDLAERVARGPEVGEVGQWRETGQFERFGDPVSPEVDPLEGREAVETAE